MDNPSFRKQRPPLRLSLTQKLGLIPSAFFTIASSVSSLFTGVFRGEHGARTYARHVLTSTIRAIILNMGLLEMRYFDPRCDQAYIQFCKSKNLMPQFEASDSGVNGFWLGSKEASRVVIHFHGGGFAMDLRYEHLNFWLKIIQALSQQDDDVAVFFPVLSLTPHATYPTQLQEAIDAVSHVIDTIGRQPGHVIISGDSAGGNLCLGIVSHQMHPSAELSAKTISSPLGGMILIGPWVSFDQTWDSVKRNAYKDIGVPKASTREAKMYLNGKESDPYNEPALAPGDWWTNCPVKQTLVVVGSDELLVDSISALVEKYQGAGNKVEFYIAPEEFHIEPLLLPTFGYTHESKTEQKIKAWLAAHAK